jgi:hypothetical protein
MWIGYRNIRINLDLVNAIYLYDENNEYDEDEEPLNDIEVIFQLTDNKSKDIEIQFNSFEEREKFLEKLDKCINIKNLNYNDDEEIPFV